MLMSTQEKRGQRIAKQQIPRRMLTLGVVSSRREASVLIGVWRRHFNAVRPHMNLGYLTPIEFKRHHTAQQSHQSR